MPVPFIIPILTTGAGVVIGALSRQPEINRLKEQVRLLQAQIERLQAVIQEQQRQINELKIRLSALKAWNFIDKRRMRATTRGHLIMQYGFKEYIELIIIQANGHVISDEDLRFFNAFSMMLNGDEIDNENKNYIKFFIKCRYKFQIDRLISMDEEGEREILNKVGFESC